MSRIRKLLGSPYALWIALSVPGLWMTIGYTLGTVFYGELMHASGELAAELLIVTLAITPLRRMFPGTTWTAWLVRRRRNVGVAAFAYAMLHTLVYCERLGELAPIVGQALEAAMWTGWLALTVMLPLAATSNNASMRRLGSTWKTLHRLAYVAAALTVAHWYLAAFDPTPGLIYFAVLGCLQIFRIWTGFATPKRLSPS